VSIDEENKFLQPLYDLYREVKGTIKEYSSMLWSKLDADLLQKSFDKLFLQMKRKLSQKYADNSVYRQLQEKIVAFKNSIPLITQLKNGSITDRHW
jgi:dynein heavy chain